MEGTLKLTKRNEDSDSESNGWYGWLWFGMAVEEYRHSLFIFKNGQQRSILAKRP